MAKLYTSSEDYLLEQERRHVLTSRLAFFVWGCVTVYVLFLSYRFLTNVGSSNFKILWVLVVGFVYLYVSYHLLWDHSASERKALHYHSGRQGEIYVLETLKELDDNHHVFYGGTIFRGNIDFAVLREDILFNIEVKNHSGNITFNGQQLLRNGLPFVEHDFIGQVIDGENQFKTMFRLSPNLQNTRIISVLVFANPKAYVETPDEVKGVHVTHRRLLNNFIQSHFK